MKQYHLDFETYSPEDIKLGAYKYAEHPETEILICAIARGDEDPVTWRFDEPPTKEFSDLLVEIEQEDVVIYAHNSQFEAAITSHLWEKTFPSAAPRLEQWRCTAAMARRAAIPSSLGECAKFLDLSTEKDSEGKRLIKKFSLPQKPTKKQPKARLLPEDSPEDFDKFVAYCYQDVIVERAIHKKLHKFELTGPVLQSFIFDAKMNARGVPVNTDALRRTDVLVEKFNVKLVEKFRAIVGLNPTQGVKFKTWLKERGYPANDLQAPTVENVLSNNPEHIGMTPEAIEALQLKTLVGFAALKKIPTMLNAANTDGRVRGALLWSGAERTHRWAGRTIQPQNFKRPVIKDTEVLYDLLCTTDLDMEDLETTQDNPLLSIASCIRHFIQPHDKTGFFDADYSAIEARIAPWLCGSEEKLQLFRDGAPIYERMGAKIFGKTTEWVVEQHEAKKSPIERFVGKQSELGCTYNMGGKKFKSSCANFGQDISQEISDKAVKTWRTDSANVPIVNAWRSLDDAAKDAIRSPGKRFDGTDKLSFRYQNVGFRALMARMPSGHCLIYPHAKLVPVWSVFHAGEANKFYTRKKAEDFRAKLAVKIRIANAKIEQKRKHKQVPDVREGEEIQFWGKANGHWSWQSTYGGKLLENCLSKETRVLTKKGLKRISEITQKDEVWDGVEYVRSRGAVCKGTQKCITKCGVTATPDHKFMVDNSWVEWQALSNDKITSSSSELVGQTSWEPKSDRTNATWEEDNVESPVRVWGGEGHACVGDNEGDEKRKNNILFNKVPVQQLKEAKKAWAMCAPALRNTQVNACQMQQPKAPCVQELRGARDHGLRSVGRLPKFLQRCHTLIQGRTLVRQDRQRGGLLPRELRVGDTPREQPEHKGHKEHRNTMGCDVCGGGVKEIGCQKHNTLVQNQKGCEVSRAVQTPECEEQVWDILDCGPRNRFAIASESGYMIAHNCTQATAGDIMSHGALRAAEKGYLIFMLVHDQALAEMFDGGSIEEFCDALCDLPEWAEGLPLEAEGGVIPFYRKD